jgi:hypothetical protein
LLSKREVEGVFLKGRVEEMLSEGGARESLSRGEVEGVFLKGRVEETLSEGGARELLSKREVEEAFSEGEVRELLSKGRVRGLFPLLKEEAVPPFDKGGLGGISLRRGRKILSTIEIEEGPLNLTMPMPPSPLGVDTAEIVSFGRLIS